MDGLRHAVLLLHALAVELGWRFLSAAICGCWLTFEGFVRFVHL